MKYVLYVNMFCADDTTKIIQLQPALRFNGGGHINHSIFWQNLSPEGGKPSGNMINKLKLLQIY